MPPLQSNGFLSPRNVPLWAGLALMLAIVGLAIWV